MSKHYLISLIMLLSTSCQSQALLPFWDLDEIEKGKSIMSNYTCEDLIEKAQDKNFSLKNLAGLRATARCPDFYFDQTQLSDLEKKLYSAEINILNVNKLPPDTLIKAPALTEKELLLALKTEKDQQAKFKDYKQLRNLQRNKADRSEFYKTTNKMLAWSLQNYRLNKNDSEAFAIAYEAAQTATKAHWNNNNNNEAIKAVDQALKSLKAKNSVAELYYLKGRVEEESKKSTEAVKNYDLALADIKKYDPKGLSFNMDRLLWLKAWVLYKDKNFEAAEPAFANLASNTTDLSEKSRAQFYQSRCLKSSGQDEAAKALLESISQNDFFGYYGLVSYRELGKKLPAIKSITPTKTITYDLKLSFLDEASRSLYLDLVKYRELSLAEKSIALIAKSKEDELNLALNFAQNNKIYMPLFKVFAKLDNSAKLEVFLNYPELVFPRPYQDEVKAMSEKTKLPTSLIYSIMKQESAFNAKARSGADAMGLMQVIPSLAKQLSKKFEVPFSSNDDLFDPTINIKLGSYELMEQVKKQNGQLTYVAAAYNAGPNALSRWLENRKRDDVLEFIEDIPYDETRTYVKLIARNKLFYERISNRDTDHEFPADFLN